MSNATHRNERSNGVRTAPADLVPLAPTAGPPADHQGAGLAPAVAQQLDAPLDPSLVAQRKGRAGHTFPYLPGRVAIQQANRLLGFGGWGYDLVGDVTPRDITTRDSETGALAHATAYTATVRLHVPGVPPRTDVGFQVVAEESAQGHETAYKGAVTDALKRALRTLGGPVRQRSRRRRWQRRHRHLGRVAAPDAAGPGRPTGLRRRAGPHGRAPTAGAGPGRGARRQVAPAGRACRPQAGSARHNCNRKEGRRRSRSTASRLSGHDHQQPSQTAGPSPSDGGGPASISDHAR